MSKFKMTDVLSWVDFIGEGKIAKPAQKLLLKSIEDGLVEVVPTYHLTEAGKAALAQPVGE